MFNTMTITKASGALIGALLALLLLFWAGSSLYHVGPSGGHGEGEEVAQAYTIPVEESAGGGEAEAEEQIDFGALMAAADAAKGEKVFGKCKACHKIDGGDSTGPHLNGVVGREIASVAGFNYSTSMAEHAGSPWDEQHLFDFLKNPKAFAANTKMSFAGLPKDKDRVDLIAFLETQK